MKNYKKIYKRKLRPQKGGMAIAAPADDILRRIKDIANDRSNNQDTAPSFYDLLDRYKVNPILTNLVVDNYGQIETLIEELIEIRGRLVGLTRLAPNDPRKPIADVYRPVNILSLNQIFTDFIRPIQQWMESNKPDMSDFDINNPDIQAQVLRLAPVVADASEIDNSYVNTLQYFDQKLYVFVPKEVTKIKSNAFAGMYVLERVVFEDGSQLTEIEENAFPHSPLEYIKIPEGVNVHDNFAPNVDEDEFKLLTGNPIQKEYLFIPQGVTKISRDTFANMALLERVVFEDDSQLTEIEEDAFAGCIGLEYIKIPIGVTHLHSNFAPDSDNLTIQYENEFTCTFMTDDGAIVVPIIIFLNRDNYNIVIQIALPNGNYKYNGINILDHFNSQLKQLTLDDVPEYGLQSSYPCILSQQLPIGVLDGRLGTVNIELYNFVLFDGTGGFIFMDTFNQLLGNNFTFKALHLGKRPDNTISTIVEEAKASIEGNIQTLQANGNIVLNNYDLTRDRKSYNRVYKLEYQYLNGPPGLANDLSLIGSTSQKYGILEELVTAGDPPRRNYEVTQDWVGADHCNHDPKRLYKLTNIETETLNALNLSMNINKLPPYLGELDGLKIVPPVIPPPVKLRDAATLQSLNTTMDNLDYKDFEEFDQGNYTRNNPPDLCCRISYPYQSYLIRSGKETKIVPGIFEPARFNTQNPGKYSFRYNTPIGTVTIINIASVVDRGLTNLAVNELSGIVTFTYDVSRDSKAILVDSNYLYDEANLDFNLELEVTKRTSPGLTDHKRVTLNLKIVPGLNTEEIFNNILEHHDGTHIVNTVIYGVTPWGLNTAKKNILTHLNIPRETTDFYDKRYRVFAIITTKQEDTHVGEHDLRNVFSSHTNNYCMFDGPPMGGGPYPGTHERCVFIEDNVLKFLTTFTETWDTNEIGKEVTEFQVKLLISTFDDTITDPNNRIVTVGNAPLAIKSYNIKLTTSLKYCAAIKIEYEYFSTQEISNFNTAHPTNDHFGFPADVEPTVKSIGIIEYGYENEQVEYKNEDREVGFLEVDEFNETNISLFSIPSSCVAPTITCYPPKFNGHIRYNIDNGKCFFHFSFLHKDTDAPVEGESADSVKGQYVGILVTTNKSMPPSELNLMVFYVKIIDTKIEYRIDGKNIVWNGVNNSTLTLPVRRGVDFKLSPVGGLNGNVQFTNIGSIQIPPGARPPVNIVNFNPNGEIDQSLLNFVDNLTINSIRLSYTVNNWNFTRQLKLILLLDPGFREGMFDKNESGRGLLPFYFINNNTPKIDEYTEMDYRSLRIMNKGQRYLLRYQFFIGKSPEIPVGNLNKILFKNSTLGKRGLNLKSLWDSLPGVRDKIDKKIKIVISSIGYLTGDEGELSESIIIKEVGLYALSQNLKSGTEPEFIKFAESGILQFPIPDIIELLKEL